MTSSDEGKRCIQCTGPDTELLTMDEVVQKSRGATMLMRALYLNGVWVLGQLKEDACCACHAILDRRQRVNDILHDWVVPIDMSMCFDPSVNYHVTLPADCVQTFNSRVVSSMISQFPARGVNDCFGAAASFLRRLRSNVNLITHVG